MMRGEGGSEGGGGGGGGGGVRTLFFLRLIRWWILLDGGDLREFGHVGYPQREHSALSVTISL